MGKKTTISNGPEALELRDKLMQTVRSSPCSDDEVLHELTAALACSAVFSGEWSREMLLEQVAEMFDVALDVETLRNLNPFVTDDLSEGMPEA